MGVIALTVFNSFHDPINVLNTIRHNTDSVKKVCVISCGFALKEGRLDEVMNVTKWSQHEELKFYFFSNLDLD